uniref:Uncharacterized protein LOC111130330 n=1 Tax=Crassostrea virginica TaxID=6565 RepID=A0A8B8DYC2_CRAVI|nr:uncharacterized protein LOC111130330 [Crassostrea virginica]
MVAYSFTGLLLLFVTNACADNQALVEEITKIAESTLKCRNNPALAISVVKDGQVVFSSGFGSRTLDQQLNVSGSTLFGVASLSKAFAATLVLKLLDEKSSFTVDTPLREVFEEDSLFKDELLSRHATIRDLLAHRMGIPNNNAIRLDTNLTRENLIKRLKFLDNTGRFRDSFYYSNLMYGLLTRIAEMLGGKKWEELVKEHLFDPIGMTSSSFVTIADPTKLELATGYNDDYGDLKEVPWALSKYWGLLCGSGCVLSTADDMAKWMLFHLNGGATSDGRQLIPKSVLSMSYTPQLRIASSTISKYYTRPMTPVTLSEDSYGMGWKTGYYRGYKIISHTGSTYGYRSKLTLFPDKDFGVFTTLTGEDSAYMYRSNLHSLISDLYLGEKPWLNATIMCSFPEPFRSKTTPYRPRIDTSRGPARNVSDYLGVYQNTPYGFLTVTHRNNQMQLEYGFGLFDLYAKTTKNQFFIHSVGTVAGMTNYKTLDFIESPQGEISAVQIRAFESKDPPVFERVYDSPVSPASSISPCYTLSVFSLSLFLYLRVVF